MRRDTRELFIRLLVSVAIVGVLGVALVLWLTMSLFGMGCDAGNEGRWLGLFDASASAPRDGDSCDHDMPEFQKL